MMSNTTNLKSNAYNIYEKALAILDRNNNNKHVLTISIVYDLASFLY